jgi:uridine kinase
MTPARPVVVGVAGGSGSGKTTVVRQILEGLRPDRVGLIHHDAYYRDFAHLPADARAAINFDHPESLETELLERHLEALLRRSESVETPVYDFTTHTRTADTVRVGPTDVIIVDGILVLAEPRLRKLMDIQDLRGHRRRPALHSPARAATWTSVGRTLDSVIHQYLESVRPMHLDFVEPSKRWADVIIPGGGRKPRRH